MSLFRKKIESFVPVIDRISSCFVTAEDREIVKTICRMREAEFHYLFPSLNIHDEYDRLKGISACYDYFEFSNALHNEIENDEAGINASELDSKIGKLSSGRGWLSADKIGLMLDIGHQFKKMKDYVTGIV